MPETIARVAKSGNVCPERGAASRGLLAKVLLNDVIPMNTVLLAQVEVKVGRSLVQIHVGESTAGEAVEGIGVRWRSLSNAVSRRNQGKQAVYGGRSDGGAIIDAGHRAGDRQALMLAYTLIGKKKEGLVLLDGAAKIGAKLVPLERGLGGRGSVEKVASVEIVVADKFEGFAVIGIGAGARGHIDDGPGVPSILGREGGVVDLEFLERVNRRLECDLVLHGIV